MKKRTLTFYKKKAWKELSVYVRIKDVDERGYATCYTCGIKKFWRRMTAGHFVQGRRPSIMFILDIIRVQCIGCNLYRHGNLNRFIPKMIEEHGLDKVLAWFELAEKTVKVAPKEYQKREEQFKRLQKGCKRWGLVNS